MANITISRTQWEWLTSTPYTDGVFSCDHQIALALSKVGYGEYTDTQEIDFDGMTRIQLMSYAKTIGVKTSRRWKKTDVIQAIQSNSGAT